MSWNARKSFKQPSAKLRNFVDDNPDLDYEKFLDMVDKDMAMFDDEPDDFEPSYQEEE